MKKGLLCTMVLFLMLAGLPAVMAGSEPTVNLPEDPVSVRIYQSPYAYTLTRLSDVPEGYDVTNTGYNGWCVDITQLVYLWWPYNAKLYSSCGEEILTVFPKYETGDWNKVNYILNHKQGSFEDVQSAIWGTLEPEHPERPWWWSLNQENIDGMIADAHANGADYVPGGGDVMAIVVFIAPNVQATVIEWTVIPRPSVSGNVFIDAFADGEFTPGEPGLQNVTVELYADDGALVSSTLTDGSGFYEFEDVADGVYSVSVSVDAAVADYFEPTADGPIQVTVENEDVTGIKFGFAPNTGSILDDVGGFAGDGKSLGYWKHQLRSAIRGKGRAHVPAATLEVYLDDIENLALPGLFAFEGPDAFLCAHDILSITSSEADDILCKHLLAAEFNEVAGLGLYEPLGALQTALIAWAEYLADNAGMYSRDDLLTAKDIMEAINHSGE
jgi:hypothetical protein